MTLNLNETFEMCLLSPCNFMRDSRFLCISKETQRAYFEYFKIVKMRDAKYSLKVVTKKTSRKIYYFNAHCSQLLLKVSIFSLCL